MIHPPIRHEVHYGRMMRCFADRPASVYTLLRDAVAQWPNGNAVISGATRLRYTDLKAHVELVASNLAARGFGRGDRIGLLVGNRPEFLVATLAAARLGSIVVPMNVRQRRPEIQYMLAHCEAAVLIFDADLASEIPNPSELPSLRSRFAVGGSVNECPETFDSLFSPCPSLPLTLVAEEDPFCILYTSGTTGKPKGAILTHLGVIHSVLHYEYGLGLAQGDVAALAVPASHVTGLIAILLSMLRVAGTTIMMESFKARDFLEIVEREHVNYTLMVPAMYNLCLLTPELSQRDLASWRIGGFGGAPMPVSAIERFAQAVPGLGLSNIYGATETTSPTSILAAADAIGQADTVGRLLPCADVVVVDADDREVPHEVRGELLIGGPMTIPGYWNNPTADAAAFVGGFWRSGDIGSMDASGYLRIHDRMKDVVNRGGYKIYCVEVENVIAGYPGVIECAVVGSPDPVLGERVHAYVRMTDDGDAAPSSISEYCAARLSDYKVPESIHIIEQALPRNANGKVVKADLRNWLQGSE